MRTAFQYVTEEYWSNCFIEAIKAKIRGPKHTRLYFCRPRITRNGGFQGFHFMWSNGEYDFDFSDNGETNLPWYKCLWFRGQIRQFPLGFASKYSRYRNSIWFRR